MRRSGNRPPKRRTLSQPWKMPWLTSSGSPVPRSVYSMSPKAVEIRVLSTADEAGLGGLKISLVAAHEAPAGGCDRPC